MSYDYRDKVIAITGGAGGIAAAFIRPAAQRGARLAVIDIRGARAQAVAAGLPGSGHRGYACDLTELPQVEGLVADLERDYGRIDVLGLSPCPKSLSTGSERMLGPQHPQTWTSSTNLGAAHKQRRTIDRADKDEVQEDERREPPLRTWSV